MDSKTIETYDRLHKEYDLETAGFWQDFPREFIGEFAELAKGKVLDIGSGPGRDAFLLKEKGLQVMCLDASMQMVKMTRKLGFESIQGDFMKLPFRDHSFESVWAYTALLHVPKAEADTAFAEIARVLAPGGVLALGMMEGEFDGYRESSGVKEPRWFAFYKKEELENILARHGFEVLYFHTWKPQSKNYLHFIVRKR